MITTSKIYKKFKINIEKITHKNSPYILPSEKPRYITYIGSQWIGTYGSLTGALKEAKNFIDKNPNLKLYKAFKYQNIRRYGIGK